MCYVRDRATTIANNNKLGQFFCLSSIIVIEGISVDSIYVCMGDVAVYVTVRNIARICVSYSI